MLRRPKTNHSLSVTPAEFLTQPTPDSWIEAAPQHLELLLLDHANCELKAASSAMQLIYRYPGLVDLHEKMSRLAREELRHFEQVLALMKKRGIQRRVLGASRYAAGLHQEVRKTEPHRLVDSLIVGAIIEARSCERFEKLAPHLDAELSAFYASLLKSEARHFLDYLGFARQYADGEIDGRVAQLLEVDAQLIREPDDLFRFHSGSPENIESAPGEASVRYA